MAIGIQGAESVTKSLEVEAGELLQGVTLDELARGVKACVVPGNIIGIGCVGKKEITY